jgi:mono/diheme cytochrome c family protein
LNKKGAIISIDFFKEATMRWLVMAGLFVVLSVSAHALEGKKVFETYCWGCHHQTAVAFGPPFAEIAAKRDAATIRAMITDPVAVYKTLGYARNAMPPFVLKEDEMQAITAYVLSFKETNTTKDTH